MLNKVFLVKKVLIKGNAQKSKNGEIHWKYIFILLNETNKKKRKTRRNPVLQKDCPPPGCQLRAWAPIAGALIA